MTGYCHRVLLVEDDAAVRDVLQRGLTTAGLAVSPVASAAAALEFTLKEWPDLVLLDLLLPDGSGELVVQRLAVLRCGVPIIVLSCLRSLETKMRLLKLGARDYITKPFELAELIARVQCVLAREVAQATICRGGVILDPRRLTATRGVRTVTLSPRIFRLLLALLARIGEDMTWEELRSDIWLHAADIRSFTAQVHVSRLRQALRAIDAPLQITSIRNRGVRLEYVFSSSSDLPDMPAAIAKPDVVSSPRCTRPRLGLPAVTQQSSYPRP
jgi:DNA-binding response OmpR family regulator